MSFPASSRKHKDALFHHLADISLLLQTSKLDKYVIQLHNSWKKAKSDDDPKQKTGRNLEATLHAVIYSHLYSHCHISYPWHILYVIHQTPTYPQKNQVQVQLKATYYNGSKTSINPKMQAQFYIWFKIQI